MKDIKKIDVHAHAMPWPEYSPEYLGLNSKKPSAEELSDDDLDAVAGGGDVSCACAMGGGGTKDNNDKTCACVLAGAGYAKSGRERCVCGFAGYGYDT